MTDGIWWFYLFWLPDYLKKQFGMTKEQVTLPTFIVYGVAIVGSVYGGSIPMTLMKRGWPVYKARMTAMFLIAIAPLSVLLTQYFGNVDVFGNKAATLAIATICIGAAAHQAWSANLFTTVSDMFPKKAVGSVTGIGRNPTSIALSKGEPSGNTQTQVLVNSRTDRKVSWVRFSNNGNNSGSIVRTLQDTRLADPIAVEDADNFATMGYVVSVADHAGKALRNYRYGPVVFTDGKACAKGRQGKELDCGFGHNP